MLGARSRVRWRTLFVVFATLGVASVLVCSYRAAALNVLAPTVILKDRHGRFLGEVGASENADGGYWTPTSASNKIVAATLAAEDRRFWQHPGVDPRAIIRALWQNVSSAGRISGASTIAMQVARLQRPGERTYARKAFEALTAFWLVQRHGRSAVLTQYLRLAPYGNRIRGIGYAARRYLDKPVHDLSWGEAAFLAALPQAPGKMNPQSGVGKARAATRGKRLLAYLLAQGELSLAEYEAAIAHIDAVIIPSLKARPESTLHTVLRFDTKLRACAEDASCAARLAAHPVVTTTLDLELQEHTLALVRDGVRRMEADGVGNAAVMIVDVATGEVLAHIGSSGYYDTEHAGAIDYARVLRSPGSTLKPFLYALALERGVITPATILADLRRPDGAITNSDAVYLGPMLPRFALANSRNVPAVEVLERVGIDTSWDFVHALGLAGQSSEATRSAHGLGLVLGALPVSLEQLVTAYAALAHDGVFTDLAWETEHQGTGRRLLSATSSRLVTSFLADPEARLPSFPRMGASEYPFPVAVKTGTSSGFRDVWTVAYSKRYLVGVWLGHPDARPMRHLTGFSSAGELAHAILLHLHQDEAQGMHDLAFLAPQSAEPVLICKLSGARATDACDERLVEYFTSATAPTTSCDVHVRRVVDKRTLELALTTTPRRYREERVFLNLSGRFAEWAHAAGGTDRSGAALGLMQVARPLPSRAVPPRLRMITPTSGLRVIHDPETPTAMASLPLLVVVEPPTPQVVWYVDGAPFATVSYPYSTRWPLKRGVHTIHARLPYQNVVSSLARVLVD